MVMALAIYNDGDMAFYEDFYGKTNDRHIYEEICGGPLYEDDMYSDSSSSTTSTESDENFPGYIPVPMSEFSDMLPGDKTKLYQAYRGQLKVSAYINYGLLTVHIVMARHLKSKFKSTCDSYVKVSLVPDPIQRTHCKTEVIHESNSPLYDEKFSFELLDEDTPKRLLISVWNRDNQRSRCEFLGCMSFGVHHILTKQKTVQGWYYLMNSELGQKKHLQVTNKKHLSEKGSKNIPSVNQDVLWMEPCVMLIKRGKSGFGFTISGSCPVNVCRIDKGSSAEAAGLKSGDCIVRIDGLNVSRSTCDSVARIIRHCQKKLILEVQRPKRVDSGFKLENMEHSPRQPLANCMPSANRPIENFTMSPWKPQKGRRMLEPVVEEPKSPQSSRRGYETQDYGWIDVGRYGDEDIYVEPDEIHREVLGIPRDPVPPALPPPNKPQQKIEDMVVSPWKNSGYRESSLDDDGRYMRLDGFRDYRESDDVMENRYEWDYSDTRLDSYQDDTPEWDAPRWQPTKAPSGQGSSSGYSSATLPRSMKFGRKLSQVSLDNVYPMKRVYCDDTNYHSNTGLGAHGDHGNRSHYRDNGHIRDIHQYDDQCYMNRPSHRTTEHQYHGDDLHHDDRHTYFHSGSSSTYSGSSSATLPKKKRVSFNVNRQSDV
ncbi:hypothetical protein LSH36_831g00019 [Paralvinella palmiformis]|uniref:Uncharacterized protein n=1 Tax=Paralvinella palmiformis TaxID=53620 RepID=A0AAD9J0A0_9ANNE|nr:hypothetical protein LSH36_831g00019 [Paralvinella palmiformis]